MSVYPVRNNDINNNNDNNNNINDNMRMRYEVDNKQNDNGGHDINGNRDKTAVADARDKHKFIRLSPNEFSAALEQQRHVQRIARLSQVRMLESQRARSGSKIDKMKREREKLTRQVEKVQMEQAGKTQEIQKIQVLTLSLFL